MSRVEKITIGDTRFDLLRELYTFKREIQDKIKKTEYDRNVFLMMKYRPSNEGLSKFILDVLRKNGLNGVRADMDEWNITRDSVINPLAVLYCCKYGIALFDEPEEGQNFSPNVAYELGIMHYQHKSCCILINESIEKKKPFDIIGKIHYQYKDNLKIQDHIEDWLRKNHVKIIQPHKQIDQIAVAIIKRGKKFLITKRKIKEGNLEWSFPAKKIKPGYNETTALVKECIAETNVEIQTINLLGERDIANNGNSMKIRYWLCKYIKGSAEVKDQDELEQVKWVTGQQAIKLISTDIFQPLKKILRGK